jgi:hypothetical protein
LLFYVARYHYTRYYHLMGKNTTNRIDCAWCKTTIRDGVEPVSHGVCPACKAKPLSTVALVDSLLELAQELSALAAVVGRRGVTRALEAHGCEAVVLRRELVQRSHAAEAEVLINEVAGLRASLPLSLSRQARLAELAVEPEGEPT